MSFRSHWATSPLSSSSCDTPSDANELLDEPMRVHGTATRRFYDAFYRWTVLVGAPHSNGRALATSTRLARNPVTRHPITPSVFRIKHLELQSGKGSSIEASAASQQPSSRQEEPHPEADPLPSIIHGEVQGPRERSFSSMQPWEDAIRYKSFAGFSVEVCMPEQIITQIEERGPLQSLLDLPDLQIDVGQTVVNKTSTGIGVPVRSVLCTGTVEDIEVMRNRFGQLRTRLAALEQHDAARKTQREGEHVFLQHRENHANTRSLKRPLQNGSNRGDERQQRNTSHTGPQTRNTGNVGPFYDDINRGVVKQKRTANHTGTVDRTKNVNRVASKPTGNVAIGKDTGRSEPKGQTIYVLNLKLEKRLTSDPNEVPYQWPTGFMDQLQELEERFGIEIRVRDAVTHLKGPLSRIEEGRRAVQSFVDQHCDRMSIPRRELMEISPPFESAESNGRKYEDQTKQILRPLTQPVVLVIAATRDINYHSSAIDYIRGVTVSSLTSVAMAPKPMVSFNLRLPSRTWDAIEKNPTICISLLEASKEGAAIAHAFTQPHEDPTEGFRQLERLGYDLVNFTRHNIKRLLKRDIIGNHPGSSAIFGVMVARVEAQSCVKVGDHVIVVAEVRNSLMSERDRKRAAAGESFGLTYANREYRMTGNPIEPMHIPEEGVSQTANDPAIPDASKDVVNPHGEGQIVLREGAASLDKTEAPENDVHEQTFVSENAIGTNQPIDESIATSVDGPIPPREGEVTAVPTTQALNSPNVEQMYQSLEQLEAAGTIDHDPPAMHDKTSSQTTLAQSFVAPASTNTTSASNVRPPPNSLKNIFKQMWRGYSTSTRSSTAEEALPATSTTTEADHLESKVSDKSLLSVTVGEFLNHYDEDFFQPRRMRAMMGAKKESDLASRELEKALANGTLTAERSKQLEDIITRNDQWLAKKLAFHAAYDLRLMLDKGKVDVRLSQWLEGAIEKGQDVLLKEIHFVQGLYDKGRLKEDKFKTIREDLEKDQQILATGTMRLRQVVIDEADESVVAPERESFDGFKGNV